MAPTAAGWPPAGRRADAPGRNGGPHGPCRPDRAATRPPDTAAPPDRRRARRRSSPPPRRTTRRGPARTGRGTSSARPAARTPPASWPPRCPAHRSAPARSRQSGPATDHGPAAYDRRDRLVLVPPEPHLETTTAAMV